MLKIIVPEKELFNENTNEIFSVKETELVLEHSLVSVSKWESKYKKPFMSKEDKSKEEIIDYIKFMTITKNVDDLVYQCLSNDNIKAINDYIQDPMTATWFSEKEKTGKGNGRVITSELIYYYMIALNIPVEFQRWHLNRLITLIEVCNEENKPPKKMSKKDLMNRNSSINAARRKALNTKG